MVYEELAEREKTVIISVRRWVSVDGTTRPLSLLRNSRSVLIENIRLSSRPSRGKVTRSIVRRKRNITPATPAA